MNKKWFLSASVFTLIIFGSVNAFLGYRLFQTYSSRMEQEVVSAFHLQTNVLADLIRNDILSGNFREARNKVARAASRSHIIKCEAKRADGQTEVVLEPNVSSPADLTRTFKVPIYFSDGGPLWGSLIFHLDTTGLASSLLELNKSLLFNEAIMTLLLIAIMLALLIFFWRTYRFLENWFEAKLQGGAQAGSRFLLQFWQPLIRRFEGIAIQFKAVELVIESIERENEERSHLHQVLHDLNSPLSAITLGISKLPQSESAELINAGTKRLESLISSSIEAKKSAKGRPGTAIMMSNLAEILQSQLSELRSQDPDASIELFKDDKRVYSSAIDLLQFQNLIGNLVRNSIEASTGPAEVRIVLRSTEKFNYIILSDKGRGIGPDVLSKLGMIPVSENKDGVIGSGSGQGLYHAFRTVKAWGGEMKVVSEIGKGTQIIIALPSAPKVSNHPN